MSTATASRSCVVCGKARIRRADGICSDCAPGYYGTAARCIDCGDPTRRASRVCVDCQNDRDAAAESRAAGTGWYDGATGLPVPPPRRPVLRRPR